MLGGRVIDHFCNPEYCTISVMWARNPYFGLLLLASFCIVHVSHAAGNFEEPCSRRKECNATVGLRCLKGLCKCANPDAQIYSPTLGACAIKIGRRCGSNDELQGDSETRNNEEENSTIEFPKKNATLDSLCVVNAECRKLKLRKWCRCKEGFMPNGHGNECIPVAKYGETCSLERPCEKRSGTECLNGSCQCPLGNQQYFDQEKRICVSFANANCSEPKVSHCVPNAECVNVKLQTGYTSDDGVKKIHTKSVTQCHCVKGYSETKDGYCKGMAGTECKEPDSCNSEAFLVCVDGQCKCRNSLTEIIDENSGKCVKLVGSSCLGNATASEMACVENSSCVNNRCECVQNYIKSPKSTCALGYKQPCLPYQCGGTGISCINAVCECFDSQLVFDELANGCVGLSSTFGNSTM